MVTIFSNGRGDPGVFVHTANTFENVINPSILAPDISK